MKVIGLLVCFLFALAVADSSANIQLDVFSGSNSHFIAIAVSGASVATESVQIQQATSSTWETANLVNGWGYYTFSSKDAELSFPISVRINSVDGHQLTLPSIISSVSDGTVDTGVQFTSASAPTETTKRSNKGGSEGRGGSEGGGSGGKGSHTSAPTTSKHTSAPTTSKHTSAPTTSKHTSAPTTSKHTSAPTTSKHTSAPTTGKTTTKPTSAPATPSGGGSSNGMKLMVPLYTDPGATWTTVAATASVVGTLAIINPDNGPGSGITSAYSSGIQTLHAAGVEIVGYVHSSYGARAIADVKADIDKYATQFSQLSGIFVDEVATSSSELSYYEELYSYIMSMPGWKYAILNPGAVPDSGYMNAATQIVTYESTTSGFANSQNPSYATSSNKNKFAMITYSGTASSMQTAINAAKSKGYYGWVYVTDVSASGNTYGSLPSFYAAEAAYVASLN